MKRIQNIVALERSVGLLCQLEPRFGAVIEKHGIPSLRSSSQGLEGLLMIITEQFLSLKAAASIWARLKGRLGDCAAATILACDETELVGLGLSRTKAKSFHAAARSDLNFNGVNEAGVTQKLCAIHGVGPWTADIYLLSVMGASDAWPVGDLALRVALQDFMKLAARPEISEMTKLAKGWRPYRAVAALLLWSHYRGLKGLGQA